MLTVEVLRSLLRYDPVTGVFTWLVKRHMAKPGDEANRRFNSSGYVMIAIDRRVYRAHRLAFLYMTGNWPQHEVDHQNGVRDDNRWSNLRDVPTKLNRQNQVRAHRGSRTGFLGVVRPKNRFKAYIKSNNRNIYLGSFNTAEEAHLAYVNAKRVLHEGSTL